MASTTTLLVSTDPTLVQTVAGVTGAIKGVRLEVVNQVGDIESRCGQGDVALVLIHQTQAESIGELTRQIRKITRNRIAEIVVLSDQHSPEQALAILRAGAFQYLSRPVDLGALAYTIDALTVSNRRPEALGNGLSLPDESFIVQPDSKLARMMEKVQRIAPLDTTILLGGETGTGKTRLASLIHQLSERRGEPFLTINCGALSANLIESEMFGHVKGAFTSADADRRGKFFDVGTGTLFLDEVDSLPISVQAKLLRAVEERIFEPVGSNKSLPMKARLIVASNRPLDREVTEGRFRADLYYRLNVVEFNLPPLRERALSIPKLANAFLLEFAGRSGRPVRRFEPDVMDALVRHTWPGNIRELRNVIERAVALCPGDEITLDDLPENFQSHNVFSEGEVVRFPNEIPGEDQLVVEEPLSLEESKDSAERLIIIRALRRHGNNRLRAAAELGISRMTLYKKLHKYGLMVTA